jgi:hypothetical protein
VFRTGIPDALEATMPRVLLIGSQEDIRQGLAASGALTGCEILTAAGNVDAAAGT